MIKITFLKSYIENDTIYKEYAVNGKNYVIGYTLTPVSQGDVQDTIEIHGQTRTIEELLRFASGSGDPAEGTTCEWRDDEPVF